MGDVSLIYQVMPESADLDLEDLKSRITSGFSDRGLNKIDEKPIAFGLKALMVNIVISDRDGGTDELEALLEKLDGVASVQCVDLTLL